ncbi:MAG: helix-turn-helix domain-containing protein [Cyclobacteriaceae bacterium]
MNIWEIIFLFFSFQAALFSVFFFLKSKERHANKIFASFLFCFAFIIFYNSLFWSGVLFSNNYVNLNISYLIPQSLLAPLFYFYLRAVIDRQKIKFSRDFWHFLPTAYVVFALLPYLTISADEKLQQLRDGSREGLELLLPYTGFALAILMLVYTAFIYRKYSRKFIEDIDLKIWIRAIYASMTLCFLSYLTYYGFLFSGILETSDDYIISAAMAIGVGVTAYFGFNQSDVFNGMPIEAIVPILKYSKTGLSETHSVELKHTLLEIMEKDKPYLNSEIRLDELASLLGVNRHQASQIINEHFNSNFYDFINKYRIQAAIEMMERNDNGVNMKEVAYDSGFNNYVSFYKAFKKYTGSLPTDFKKGSVLAKS